MGTQMHMALAPQFGLTPRERDCLAAIETHVSRVGCAPSLRELAGMLGLVSKSGVHRLVADLEERGWIRRLPNRARSIEIVARSQPAKVWTLPAAVQTKLLEHCELTGEKPDDVLADAVVLFLDEAEADAA